MDMCIRCQKGTAPDPLGLCPACAVQTRIELSDGFRRLQRYLTAWADFERWLTETGRS